MTTAELSQRIGKQAECIDEMIAVIAYREWGTWSRCCGELWKEYAAKQEEEIRQLGDEIQELKRRFDEHGIPTVAHRPAGTV